MKSDEEVGVSKALTYASYAFLLVSGPFALFMLVVGLSFSAFLWNPDPNPFRPLLIWLGVLAAPCVIAITLKCWRDSARAKMLALIAACGLIGPYLADVFNH
jgi:hypothetical protein